MIKNGLPHPMAEKMTTQNFSEVQYYAEQSRYLENRFAAIGIRLQLLTRRFSQRGTRADLLGEASEGKEISSPPF